METNSQGRRLVIGDIHGCKKTFVHLLDKTGFDKKDQLYILGDMINRGPDSRGVLKKIIAMKDDGYNITCIKGNHEQMLLDIVHNEPDNIHRFVRYYKSAGLLNIAGVLKPKYYDFLASLPDYVELDDNILVHAALDLSSENIFDNKQFMLYSRYQRGNIARLNNKRLIHGHVALDLKIIKNSIAGQYPIVGIDNGCVYGTTRAGFGKLICLDIDNNQIWTKTNCDI